MRKAVSIEKIIPWVVYAIAAYLVIFLKLDGHSIRLWDESLYANNVLEMDYNGNWLVKYLRGKPDHWNTKPPLMIWIQVIFFKILGPTELALRLPIALLAVGSGFLLIDFSNREFGKSLPGFLAAMVLITIPGFSAYHVGRTGDHDAALTFFLLGTALFFYRWLLHEKRKHLVIMTAMLIAAVMTKSVSGLLFVPGMFLFALLFGFMNGDLLLIFRRKGVYLSILVFMVVVLGFYFIREAVHPGFLKAVWINELGGRYLSTIESHQHPFWWYWNNLFQDRLIPWIFFLPFSLIFLVLPQSKPFRNFTWFVLILTLSYFFIISGSSTKLQWYDAPLFPLVGCLVGYGFAVLIWVLLDAAKIREGVPGWIFTAVFVLFVFIRPFSLRFDNAYYINDIWGPEQYGNYLKERRRGGNPIKKMWMLDKGRNLALHFYAMRYNHEYDYQLGEAENAENFQAGDTVLCCHEPYIQRIWQVYWADEIDSYKGCRVFLIKNRKPENLIPPPTPED